MTVPQQSTFDASLSVERRSYLVNRLAMLGIAIAAVRILFISTDEGAVAVWAHIAVIVVLTIGLLFTRFGYFKTGASFSLLATNAVVFVLASSEPYETAVGLHLVSTGFAGIVLFAREHKWYGIAFALLSIFLYDLAAMGDIHIIHFRHMQPGAVQKLFVMNSSVCSFCCIFILYSIMKLNSSAKDNLVKQQREINFQNQILSKNNAELDRFVYSASHDLRAPLSSIAGLIELSQRDSNNAAQYLVMIKDRIGVMDRFISEVIDYSKNARLGIDNDRIQLKALVDQVISLLRYAIADPIEVFNNVPANTEIESDRARLQVVLSNLISNAVKYSDLRKSSPFIKITCESTAKEHHITIADNGIGIQPEHQAKIFEMFYRATERSKGSGLGLFIVKETLEKLGGQIEVHSEHGVGSAFKLKLPIIRS